MLKTCASCGALYGSINPFRKLCDACQERRSEAVLVVLGIVDGDLEANIWVDILQQEGIPAMVRQNDAIRGRFQTAPMPFSTEVMVREQDLKQARELFDLDPR